MSTAPTIRKALRAASWRATAAPIGPKPDVQHANRHRRISVWGKHWIICNIRACAFWLRALLGVGGLLTVACGGTKLAGSARPAAQQPACARRALAAQRELSDRRPPRARRSLAARSRAHPLAQHQRAPHQRAAVSSLLERVAQRRLDLAARAAPRRQHQHAAERRVGLDRLSVDPVVRGSGGADRRPYVPDSLHRARRRQHRRSDGDLGATAGAGCAERDDRHRPRVEREDSAAVLAHRLHRRLLLLRPVVPEARRPRRRRLEHAPVPLRHRVLFRLRRLRRADDRAARVRRRRIRPRARRHGQRQRHDGASLPRRGHPRLRVDGEPALSRAHADVRASDAAPRRRCACCCSRSTRARRRATSRRPRPR